MSRPERDLFVPGRVDPLYADVEPNPRKLYVLPDGRTFVDNTVTVSVEKAEMMWQGYLCASCLEPFREAYPEACPLCGFPVREHQRRLLERDFLGVDPTLVGSFPLDREMEHLDRVGYRKKGLMTVPKEI